MGESREIVEVHVSRQEAEMMRYALYTFTDSAEEAMKIVANESGAYRDVVALRRDTAYDVFRGLLGLVSMVDSSEDLGLWKKISAISDIIDLAGRLYGDFPTGTDDTA